MRITIELLRVAIKLLCLQKNVCEHLYNYTIIIIRMLSISNHKTDYRMQRQIYIVPKARQLQTFRGGCKVIQKLQFNLVCAVSVSSGK